MEVMRAVLRTGFRGWFSMEIFDGGPGGNETGEGDVREMASDAMEGHVQLLDSCAET